MACINNNYEVNAMEDENPNKIIGNNIGDDNKNNNNISKINEQQNNEFLQIEIDNENDKEKIKELVTQPLENARIIQLRARSFTCLLGQELIKLTVPEKYMSSGDEKQRYYHYYRCYEISNLLESFNNWNLNKLFTVDQLKTIYDIVKSSHYFLNHKDEIRRDIEFVIDDEIFGVGFRKLNDDNHYGKCIFIQPNRYGLFIIRYYNKYHHEPYDSDGEQKKQALTSMSFKNFVDAVKLCSTKKLPIQFTNDNKDKYFITSNEYRDLLLVLLRDFWIAFHGEYKYDLLRLSPEYHILNSRLITINSDKEYEMLKKEYENLKEVKNKTYEEYTRQNRVIDALYYYDQQIMLKKIKKAFKEDYNEQNFIEIFGEETINNIRYIIHHLIDIEMHNNNDFLINKIKMNIENILGNNAIEYDNKDISLEEVINYVMNELINNNFTNIINSISYQNEELVEDIISLINKNENILDTQRLYYYIYKLLYYKPLEKYIKENILLNTIKLSKINKQFIRHSLKKKVQNKIPTIINSFLYSHDIKDVDKMILEMKNTKK